MDSNILENKAASDGTDQPMCRLCLSEDSLDDIFEQDSLNIWISKFLSVVISQSDGIGHLICVGCRQRIHDFREYQLSCLKVQSALEKKSADDGNKGTQSIAKRFVTIKGESNENSEDMENSLFKCCKCEKTFKTKRGFTMHNDTYHTSMVFKCEICDELYPAIHLLRTHLQTHGKRERKHACTICGYAFYRKPHLKNHMAVHKKKQMKIEVLISQRQHGQQNDVPANNYEGANSCGDRTEYNFNEPETSNSVPGANDIFEVEDVKIEPNDSFEEQEANFEMDSANHRAAKPKNQPSSAGIECDICHKTYKSKKILSAHKYTIHFPKSIECSKCYQTFPSSSRLTHHNHMVHKAERKHACAECGAEFVTRFNLTRHMKVHVKGYVRKQGRKWKLPQKQTDGDERKHDTESLDGVPGSIFIKQEV